MTTAVHSEIPRYQAPLSRAYERTGAYWAGAVALTCLTSATSWDWLTIALLVVTTPAAILLLAELSRELRCYANMLTIAMAPDLEFFNKGSLLFHAIRTLLIVTELATALMLAKLVVRLLSV